MTFDLLNRRLPNVDDRDAGGGFFPARCRLDTTFTSLIGYLLRKRGVP
jgi:hypothetical protein